MNQNTVNPEVALKYAESHLKENDVGSALEVLDIALRSKKNKGNNVALEKLMLKMIDICCENLMLYTLKDCLGHFRNLCQYTDRDKLENVLVVFRQKADKMLENCIKDFGADKISGVFAEDLED